MNRFIVYNIISICIWLSQLVTDKRKPVINQAMRNNIITLCYIKLSSMCKMYVITTTNQCLTTNDFNLTHNIYYQIY